MYARGKKIQQVDLSESEKIQKKLSEATAYNPIQKGGCCLDPSIGLRKRASRKICNPRAKIKNKNIAAPDHSRKGKRSNEI